MLSKDAAFIQGLDTIKPRSCDYGYLLHKLFLLQYVQVLIFIYLLRDDVVLIKDSNFYNLNDTQQKEALKYIEVMNSGKIYFRQLME